MTQKDYSTFSQKGTMFRLILVLCLLVAAQGASLPVSRRHLNLHNIFHNGKIVGGSPITINQAPWQVALEGNGHFFCGGSIISPNYVLTAAHCVDEANLSLLNIRSGTSKYQSGGTVTKVSSIAWHPGFTHANADYDVAVLKLASTLTFDDKQAAVALRKAEASAGETALVSGWGHLSGSDTTFPEDLQAVNIPIIARNTCNVTYEGRITDRMFCAGEEGKDSCQGDSGGPVTINKIQVGVVSWGYGCATAKYPGVNANVAALRTFIDQNSNNEAVWV